MLDPGSRLRSLAVSVAAAALLLVATRQLGPAGCHAPHGAYRAQVDAFLDGRLALTPYPEGLAHDLAWTGSGVQQVWGLGAPAWQTPFELLGRAVGITPFPDRVALCAWLALAFFAVARGFGRRDREREPWWVGAGTIAIAALLPAFVALLHGKLGVYEEAAAYAYGAALMMLGSLASFARRPSAAGFVLLAGLSGLGGLIRPTVWFYGAATLAIATAIWIRHALAGGATTSGGRIASEAGTARAPARARRWWGALALGLALFVAGGGLLYATNARRFGRGAEFGHRLNLHSLPGNIVSTRFSYPFERARLGAASAELFGGLFDRPERRSKRGFYQPALHVGQQPIARWREYYFTTYSWPYAPLLAAGLVLGALAWRRRGVPDPAARWLGPWALLGLAPLIAFYLWSPSLSSRYQLDLAPGFVALLAITWRAFARYARAGLAATALVAAWVGAVATSKVTRPRTGGDPVGGGAAAAAAYRISRPLPDARTLPDGHDADAPDFGVHSDIAAAFAHCADATGAPLPCDAPPVPGDLRVVGRRDVAGWLVERARIPDAPADAGTAFGAAPICLPDDPPSPDAPRCEGPPTVATDSDAVLESEEALPPPLYLDGFGWDLETRRVAVATYFFAADPRFVELEIEHAPAAATPAAAAPAATASAAAASAAATPAAGSPAAAAIPAATAAASTTAAAAPTGPRSLADWAKEVRVAVGLTHLVPVLAADTARGVRLRFESPSPRRTSPLPTSPLPAGLQVIFLAFGPDARLDQPRSDYRLHAIRWR